MFKRRSTIDEKQKQKRNKMVEMFGVLQLCMQISHDDKLIIRNQIKNNDEELIAHVKKCKKDKNYAGLQIYLRKYVQRLKGNAKYMFMKGLRDCSMSKRSVTSLSKKNAQTEASYPTSVQNSLHSSPTAQKPKAKATLDLKQTDLRDQFDCQKEEQQQKWDFFIKQKKSEKPGWPQQKKMMTEITSQITNQYNGYSLQLKNLLKQKIKKPKLEIKTAHEVPTQPTSRHPMYGEFYKRIREVIDEKQN